MYKFDKNLIKKNQFFTVIKHGSIYFINNISIKAASLIILPIITRYLTIEEYGLYTNLYAVLNLTYIFAVFGLDSAYSRFVYDDSSHNALKKLTSTLINVLLLWDLAFLIISYFVFSIFLKSWDSHDCALSLFVSMSLLIKQFTFFNVILMKTFHKTRRYISLVLSSVVLTKIFSLYLLLVCNLQVRAFFIADASVNALFLAIHMAYINKERLYSVRIISKNILGKCLKYGLGYIPLSFTSWIFNLSDKLIITFYGGLYSAGRYSFIYQIAMLINIFNLSINNAYAPIYMQLMKKINNGHNKEQNLKKLRGYIYVIIYVLLLIYLCLSFFAPHIIELLFPEKFHGNYKLLYIIGLGFVFLAIRKIFANVLVYYKKSLLISITGYVPAIINIIMNLIFIPIFGIYAAAVSTLASFLVYALAVFIIAQKLMYIKINYLKILVFFIAAITSVLFCMNNTNLLLRVALLFTYLFIGYILGIAREIKGA